MEEEKSYRSWTISYEFWEAIKEDIPKRERGPKKKMFMPLVRIVSRCQPEKRWKAYFLYTGCQWKALPREYGSGSTVQRTFQNWLAAGFFEKIWAKGLERYDELDGIDWEWQSFIANFGISS